ncbi:hypothetical protein FNF29_03489 [Cafeteria roenbergensis]|uniref:Uncharacterized protein n=1 Tax=Cafeteria roenbergensis TaxID=33653 RepID=A0A5A8CIX2_CAFRO|nr:hypothetical protein FNF29_03489 [Cafeteria roenbergensis]|eukprot:KAA0152966.1 hypothetical protein FNF29_03489 [Cafeteria roenbergensis]
MRPSQAARRSAAAVIDVAISTSVRLRVLTGAEAAAQASEARPQAAGALVASSGAPAGSESASTSWLRRAPAFPVVGAKRQPGVVQLADVVRDLPVGGRTTVLIAEEDAHVLLSAATGSRGIAGQAAASIAAEAQAAPVDHAHPSHASDAIAAISAIDKASLVAATSLFAVVGRGHSAGDVAAPARAESVPSLPGRGMPLLDSARSSASAPRRPPPKLSPAAEALHAAASAGDIQQLRELLGRAGQSGAPLEAAPPSGAGGFVPAVAEAHPDSGATALHVLVAGPAGEERGDVDQGIAVLLASGADVDARAANGSTPLHWAAGSGAYEAVAALLERGADPLCVTYTWHRQVFGKGSGRTPLHWAAERGCEESCKLLSDAVSGVAAAVPDERGVLASEAAMGEGFSALSRKLQAAEGRRFVCVEVEALGGTASAVRR